MNIQKTTRLTKKFLENLPSEDMEYLKTIHPEIKTAAYILKAKLNGLNVTGVCPICNSHLKFRNVKSSVSTNDPNVTCQRKCAFKKAKNTMIQKYGVENPGQLDTHIEKCKETNLKKYGTEWFTQTDEYIEKCKETSIRVYGVHHYVCQDIVKENIKNQLIQKYGVDSPLKNKEQKEKFKKTCLEKYGVEYPMQQEEIKNKSKETCLEKYGTENPGFLFYKGIHHRSSLELEIDEFIKGLYPGNVFNNHQIKNKELDIYIPELKLSIEVNGDYWHSVEKQSNNKQLEKTSIAEQQGIRLIHIWEHEWNQNKEFIKSLLTLYLENKVHQNEFQKLLEQFNNRLPRDYFQALDFSGEIEEPNEEIVGKKHRVIKTGYILL